MAGAPITSGAGAGCYVVLTLCQAQFHIPFPMSVAAAYYATRASQAWAPLNHDLRAVEAWYVGFYRLAQRYGSLRFDPEQVAALAGLAPVHEGGLGPVDEAVRFQGALLIPDESVPLAITGRPSTLGGALGCDL